MMIRSTSRRSSRHWSMKNDVYPPRDGTLKMMKIRRPAATTTGRPSLPTISADEDSVLNIIFFRHFFGKGRTTTTKPAPSLHKFSLRLLSLALSPPYLLNILHLTKYIHTHTDTLEAGERPYYNIILTHSEHLKKTRELRPLSPLGYFLITRRARCSHTSIHSPTTPRRGT
jgi:hypothetical protein